MNELPSPDRFRLSAALGWLELGNSREAEIELDGIEASLQSHPHVLAVRWQIQARAGTWDEAVGLARSLVELEPGNVSHWIWLAYATRRMTGGGLQPAWEVLRPVAERFPEEPIVAYNLACYACQLGRSDEAAQWLAKAVSLGGDAILSMAREDEDLRPLGV
jgi:predicted Zn-dependent protease